jgi:hypothetical protein
MTPEELGQDGISRRKMLKRIGAGAAVAWSAPILTSMRAPAFAQQPNGCEGASACDPDSPCDPSTPCAALDTCGPSETCACFVRTDVSECCCGAFPSNFCADYPPCASDADCAPGFLCYASCCPAGICRGPCTGSSAPRRTRGTGATLTR